MNWDHLRTFESVARRGSLSAAARALGVSQSTVSRQLARLEERAGSPLLLRESPVRLTQRGAALLAAVRPMIDAALAAQAALEETPTVRGEVTISSVGELLRWVLVERLAGFYARYPALRLRLLSENQITSLAAGDADIALRFARPRRGELVARRVHTERYGLYLADAIEPSVELPWLGLAGALASIPEQREAARLFAGRAPRLLVGDYESLGRAVEAGLGVALLPSGLAARLGGLARVEPARVGARGRARMMSRDLWMVVHRSKQRLPKVRAVTSWLREIFDDDRRDR